MYLMLPKRAYYIPSKCIFICVSEKRKNRFRLISNSEFYHCWEEIKFNWLDWQVCFPFGMDYGKDPFEDERIPAKNI